MSSSLYKPVLIRLLSYLDSTPYSRETEFEDERLRELTPEDLMRWFNKQVFGSEAPGENDKALVRSSAVDYWKKAISYFMPNKLMQWNEINRVGNPTKSTLVNNLLKRVKKLEVRKLGVTPKARRPLTEDEFRKIVTILKEAERGNTWSYGVPAQLCFQVHLIARMDDTMNVLLENVDVHPRFPFCLKTRLKWSKNVREERDAPWQIMIGSRDSVFCVMINLALWLEVYFENYSYAMDSPYLFAFSADCRIPEGGTNCKNALKYILMSNIFKNSNLRLDDNDCLGSHSLRKFGATRARRCGVSKDEKDTRGRWKCRRVSDVYEDIELPWPDLKVAASLCIGGPCKYKVVDKYVNDDFLLNIVGAGMNLRLKRGVTLCLARALLYFTFKSRGTSAVPENLSSRIMRAYEGIQRRTGDSSYVNPVECVALAASGNEGEVYLDEVGSLGGGEAQDVARAGGEGRESEGGGTVGNDDMFSERSVKEQLRVMQSSLYQMRYQIEELTKKIELDQVNHKRQYQNINTNMKRMANSPGRPISTQPRGGISNTQSNYVGTVSLSPTPRTIFDLWDEWTVGLGGRKPAKDFTSMERGKVKYKYCRRKVVWDTISKMVRGGMTAHAAMDKILDTYGRYLPLTKLINIMLRDRKNGTVPSALEV